MARCKELLNCILLRKVLNFRNRVRKVLIEWYQFDTSFKYMAESLILDPINFNIICILLDYNFRQLLIRITFKLVQLFVKCLTWNHEKVILIKIGVFSKGKILIQHKVGKQDEQSKQQVCAWSLGILLQCVGDLVNSNKSSGS